MERKKLGLPFVLATAAALVYMLALTQEQKRLAGEFEPVTILVAQIDLPERSLLRPELVRVASVPRRFVAPDAIEARTASDLKLVENLVTRIRIPKGTALAQSALAPISPGTGLSVKVPPGYRGSVLPVDRSMLALLKPGDRVDILLTFDALLHSGRKEKVTATLLQSVLVLSVGGDMGPGVPAAAARERQESDERAAAFAEHGVISVALNPKETQYLALALEQGKTFVSVRGLGDLELHPIEMAALAKLFAP